MLFSVARIQQLFGHWQFSLTKSLIRQDERDHVQDIQQTSHACWNRECLIFMCNRKNNRYCHRFRIQSFTHSSNLLGILASTRHSQTHKCRKKSHRLLDEDLDGKRKCLHISEEWKQKESTRRNLALIVVILARKWKMLPNH